MLENVCRQLAVLYSEEPTVSHIDFDVAPLFGRTGLITRSGLWPLMQMTQQFQLALREVIIRIDAPKSGLVYRLVTPDYVYCRAHMDDPDRPIYYQELRLRTHPHTGDFEWVADCLDISDPDYPSFTMHKIKEDGSKGQDVSDIYMDGPLFGDAYPYRDREGRPFLPMVLYHAEKTGQLWDWSNQSQLTFGSLTSSCLFSMWLACVRDSSWPQRWCLGASLNGLTLEDQNLADRRASITTDPSSILMFHADEGSTGQPMIGQWAAGSDPEKLLESISKYEIRCATAAGISGDILRQSGDPRSGYAISVSRDGQRQLARRFAPIQRHFDEELIAKSAILCNRFKGTNYPEDGYRVQYSQLPLSPDEMKALREDIIIKMEHSLISPVEAIQMLNPDLDQDAAKMELLRIRRERAEFIL